MLFFLPECNDKIDNDHDFINEVYKSDRDTYNDLYIHEVFKKIPFDGMLVSKINIENNKTRKEKIRKLGIHNYIRLPKKYPIIGDCGSFGYIDKENPMYNSEEIINYYQEFGFDYGVSIDHLILPFVYKKNKYYKKNVINDYKEEITEKEYNELSKVEKNFLPLFCNDNDFYLEKKEYEDNNEKIRRLEITIKNAYELMYLYNKNNYTFIPIGAIQGWDLESYCDCVKEIIKFGYKYIAIGSIVSKKTDYIISILEKIRPLTQNIKVHLFGVTRLDSLKEFNKLGVSSFDSTSYLRKSWCDTKCNYIFNDNGYTAIRIPYSNNKKINNDFNIEIVKKLENDTLQILRQFDRNQIDIDNTFKSIKEYNKLTKNNKNYDKEIYRTLQSRIWEKCDCDICKKVGLDIIIFRGGVRNKLRGFHNVNELYKKLQKIRENF